MEIERAVHNEGIRLKLRGRLDATWSELVQESIAECIQEGFHSISLDMIDVDYVSSAGLRVLVGSYKKLQAIRGSFRITSASSTVGDVLSLSGLDMLLAATGTAGKEEGGLASREFGSKGVHFQSFEIGPCEAMQADLLGDVTALHSGESGVAQIAGVCFGRQSTGLGIGAFASDALHAKDILGEFLAVNGIAAFLPGDGKSLPDFLSQKEDFLPTVQVLYGFKSEGDFSHLLRFESQDSIAPLSMLADTVLGIHSCRTACIVMLAETAAIVGAWLRRSPAGAGNDGGLRMEFPGIRNTLAFTPEPSFPKSLSLTVGVVTRDCEEALAGFVRPLTTEAHSFGHFHSAIFPYSPIQKGCIELNSSIRNLMEGNKVMALLHLLNDWRDAQGAGESMFSRGAIWSSPVSIRRRVHP